MLYEFVGVVRPGDINIVKELVKSTGTQILNAGGVVRGITNWGIFQLPKPRRHHGVLYNRGHYFIMRFDSSPRTQHMVRKTLHSDVRMLKYGFVKMGSTLEQIKDVGGKAEWPKSTSD
ncbi:hypothetical protein LTR66_001245 [Elasticomyces elasticus]|nr:hypothetical protein LTR50_001247 [Elasticomyces elasticus]KAK4995503.1 hypothetical protein LTR66_004694 [Elasticomyces elasticus]KAK4999788.1 hypothetical protein LTR66_001245 [Elasticomyces elasticus]